MALTKEQYGKGGIQDYSDVMDRGDDKAWKPEQNWEFDGKTVTEAEFQAAWAHFEKTGERPDWWG